MLSSVCPDKHAFIVRQLTPDRRANSSRVSSSSFLRASIARITSAVQMLGNGFVMFITFLRGSKQVRLNSAFHSEVYFLIFLELCSRSSEHD